MIRYKEPYAQHGYLIHDMQTRENKSEVQTCASEVRASVFWDNEEILLVEFSNSGEPINSQRYVVTSR